VSADHSLIPERAADEAAAHRRIDRALGRARLNLLWEQLWPRVAPLAALAATFAALSWFGVWRLTSTPLRLAVLAAFIAAALYCLWRLARLSAPSRAGAFARVETATGAPHRPATSFADRLATPADSASEALWLAHRRRLLAALGRVKAGIPSPRLDVRDPYALRYVVVLLFAVGFVVAGEERIARLGEAFQGGESAAATVARIDAWVTPPAYTDRPPIFLTGDAARPPGTEYSVPSGSVVTVRTGGARDLDVLVSASTGETPVAPVEGPRSAADGALPPLEHQATLVSPGRVIVRKSGRDIAIWPFAVEPDHPPEIALAEDPRIAASGALHLIYSLKDDYGVVGALAEFAPLGDPAEASGARPLYEAPTMPLSLPQLRTRSGNGDTTRDLTSHPWAGARVKLTLVDRDDAKQEGRSTPIEITLPVRHFFNPLARAVVEQRAKLALDANAVPMVGDALDALTIAPDKTFDDIGTYLALRSAYHRLNNARGDDDLRAVVDYLWTIALAIEDGDMSLAAEALRNAQDALRDALERGAPDEEIARLTQELRDALQKFLQAMAEEARRNPDMARLPPDANTQTLRSEDLSRMLDRIEELARTGARDAARQLLSQLQNVLENLQAGRPQMGDPQSGQMMESLNQLGDMIRRQEELMNRTFRAERGMSENGEPLTQDEIDQLLQQLQQGQQALADALQKLMEGMQGQGMEPNGKLGQAGDAMGRAGEQLGAGDPGTAVGEQGNALDALRQGAQGLAQQLANRGQGQGSGHGFRNGDGNGFANQDPLGRPQRNAGPDLGTTVKVPDEIDTQRAREILDAIRKRLGETFRPEFERDYLERLLDRF
jgi:uncharacterized protein (TIGR02302 family)